MKTEKRYILPKEGGLDTAVPVDIVCRYEKVKTNVFPTEYEGIQLVADMIVTEIKKHEKKEKSELFVLGLTTGRTPFGLYKELVKRYEAGQVSFKNVSVYSLDEFYPITPNHQQSRNYRIHEEFINHVDIDKKNVHFPDGTVEVSKVTEFCTRYDKQTNGKIDLMIMGVGEQGQLGFNEPGSYFKSKTHLVQLSYYSLKVQSQFFPSKEDVPKMAITMGLDTIMNADKIVLMAWGEDKSQVIKQIVEGDVTDQIPASCLQNHPHIQVVIDEDAAQDLTQLKTPWVVGSCTWTPKLIRTAVIWLCEKVKKPILKLTYQDYASNSLSDLLDRVDTYDQININVFNDIQHVISGWPGGKPNADDSTRPVSSTPYPKKVLIFSPHPDDDVISMGGTFHRLIEQGHDVHVAYETSGNVAVYDDVVLQNIDTVRELGYGNDYEKVKELIDGKVKGQPEPRKLLDIKGAIRRAEARAACRVLGLNDRTNAHFLNLPFYETGGIKKGKLGSDDISIVVALLREIKPDQIYAAGDLTDPHGTHRVCINAVLEAMEVVKDDDWAQNCHIWLYRGAWQEWNLGIVDMAVPLSPDELIKKRHAIFRHLSQKDIVPFPGEDQREFWERAEERTQNTARLFDRLGMAEYQAIEMFVKMK